MKAPRLLCALALAALLSQVRVNLSSSLPRGLYCRMPTSSFPAGALVALCLPPDAAALYRAHGRAPRGSCPDHLPPFLKAVAARGGELVTFGPDGVRTAAGLLPFSAPRPVDSEGRPLLHAPFGTYRIPSGDLWLYGPHPHSFDSRYFGPQPAVRVLYRAMALWPWDSLPTPCRLSPFSPRLLWSSRPV